MKILQEQAYYVLHRLVACTNRRMHKGFPEIFSYILGKPHYYCSHPFTSVVFENTFRHILKSLYRGMGLNSQELNITAVPVEVTGGVDAPDHELTEATENHLLRESVM